MSAFSQPETIFLEIGFQSSDTKGKLQQIYLIGIPGENLPNGQCTVSPKTRLFFDDSITRSLFQKSRFIPECDFRFLKIWLYDTETSNEERGYEIPKIDERDLCLLKNNSLPSKLEKIFVLDNELQGREYEIWKKCCQELFGSLFSKFIAPPEPPDIVAENFLFKPMVDLIDGFTGNLDRYGKMKKKLFFNALIIQVD
ncbi:MAG: hypothetical protein SAJ37_17175 [Oscillatoria sp. PMC 1068.18]|nr:hypothetical protein [Oscillatoria sp. PMC 1076.18]MEC4990465.1 hypothetical protein [Oscillatoria sp. PMC 1068.18]